MPKVQDLVSDNLIRISRRCRAIDALDDQGDVLGLQPAELGLQLDELDSVDGLDGADLARDLLQPELVAGAALGVVEEVAEGAHEVVVGRHLAVRDEADDVEGRQDAFPVHFELKLTLRPTRKFGSRISIDFDWVQQADER